MRAFVQIAFGPVTRIAGMARGAAPGLVASAAGCAAAVLLGGGTAGGADHGTIDFFLVGHGISRAGRRHLPPSEQT